MPIDSTILDSSNIASYGIVFIFGAIIGSFLNVYIYRLNTSRSLGGRSHCMSCHKTLMWFELIPLISFILQRGKCRGCSSRITTRYILVEVLTGLTYVLVWYVFKTDYVYFFLNVLLVSILVPVVVYDMLHTIIPDRLVFYIVGVCLVMFGYTNLALWNGFYDLGLQVFSACIGGFFFFTLWFVSKGRWIGLGDAKLALPLGFVVGTGTFSMIILSFWIGAAVSLVLLGFGYLIRRGKIRLHFLSTPRTMKSEVPFAPFLVLGFLLVHLFHANIFFITASIFFPN